MTKTVLITGASRGIGYATAELFVKNGWNVAICSRDDSQIKRAAEQLLKTTSNKNILGVKADIGDASSVDHLFDVVRNRFVALDALVNNAAVLHTGNVFELSDSDIMEMMRINVMGLIRCCKHAFTEMKNNGGSIVNVSSLAGVQGTVKFPDLWGYTASKFAVTGLTEGLAVEGKPYNIRVNCVAPGSTDTQMLQQAAPGMKPTTKPADIAHIIYYLCDNEQSGVLTGTTIPVFHNK